MYSGWEQDFKMADTKSVAIVGGGLVGALQTIFMAKEGYEVHMYDNREDPRKTEQAIGRSINLSLSRRGMEGLNYVGLRQKVVDIAVPMRGRMIHRGVDKPPFVIPYGSRTEDCLYSTPRKKLNELLLSEAESLPNVRLHFQHKLTRVNFESMRLNFADASSPVPREVVAKHDFVFGCDGAFSTVRRQMMRQSPMDYRQEYIRHGYKELTMPAASGEPGGAVFAMPPHYLHIWAKGTFMMIALPDPRGSFTVTLYMPYSYYEGIDTEEDVLQFFRTNFPDALPLIGEERLVRDFFKGPISSFMSVRCGTHHIDNNAVLLGDAAHAMVPFFGEGVNCGFEDCLVFLECLKSCGQDLVAASKLYSQTRVPDAHAICDLSMYNYIEMRSHVNSWSFLFRKGIIDFLHRLFPKTVIPLHSMVTLTRLSYRECVRRNARQEAALTLALRLACLSLAGLVTGLAIKFAPTHILKVPAVTFKVEF